MALFFKKWLLFLLFALTPQIHPHHFIEIEEKVLFKKSPLMPRLVPYRLKNRIPKREMES
jgi:hypothetical protein